MIRKVDAVNWVVRSVFKAVCRIDVSELKKVPQRGPLILVANHVNFLDAPVMIPHLAPREVIGLAKRETWDNPLFSFLFTVWGGIPIDRGTVDREAFRLLLDALAQGKILAVAPEGTRSKNGSLLQGKPGIVVLAQRSGAPLLPMGIYGHEHFWANLKSLRRTDFYISVGKPFRLAPGAESLTREQRQAAADEIMLKIAGQLPERYHGYYQGMQKSTYQYLEDVE